MEDASIKRICLLLCVLMLALSLTGCHKDECAWCTEEKQCGTMTVWGEEVPACPACEREIEDIRNEMMGED